MNDMYENYDKDFQDELRIILKNKRIERKLSMEVVSNYLDTISSTYARYEGGTRNIPLSVMKKLCNFYNMDYYELFKTVDKKVSTKYVSNYINITDINDSDTQLNYMDLLNKINKIQKELSEVMEANEYFKRIKKQ